MSAIDRSVPYSIPRCKVNFGKVVNSIAFDSEVKNFALIDPVLL